MLLDIRPDSATSGAFGRRTASALALDAVRCKSTDAQSAKPSAGQDSNHLMHKRGNATCRGQGGQSSNSAEVVVMEGYRIREREEHKQTVYELGFFFLSVHYNTDLGHVPCLSFFCFEICNRALMVPLAAYGKPMNLHITWSRTQSLE
jgi:hypothetical protein